MVVDLLWHTYRLLVDKGKRRAEGRVCGIGDVRGQKGEGCEVRKGVYNPPHRE